MLPYILKLSVSLSFVYLFYRVFLRKLTFHQWNRWYLLGYTAFSFLLPFINIDPFLEKQTSAQLNWVPNFNANIEVHTVETSIWTDPETWAFLILGSGILFFAVRFAFQFYSIWGIRKKSSIVAQEEGITMYSVNESIVPFSFGNAIYLNPSLHAEKELDEILRHEFVHVRQRHTIDMVWTELLCILNWYNPFAWLLRHAIRQNLEFIADHQVLQHGVDKKQYQYLLLKVMGTSPYSMGVPFNLHSLKKRIVMMNQMRSAKVHLLKFLFLLPMLSVLLLSFRTQQLQKIQADTLKKQITVTVVDTIPGSGDKKIIVIKKMGDGLQDEVITENIVGAEKVDNSPNAKGYIVSIAHNAIEEIVIVKNAAGRIAKAISLEEWKGNAKKYEKKYGPLPTHRKAIYTFMSAPGMDEGIVWSPKQGQHIESLSLPMKGLQTETVTVNATAPGSIKKTITIRSSATDTLSKPLIYMDGVKIVGNTSLNDIDPQQIATINVLKGEKATANYGQEGQHGVILIQTKKAGGTGTTIISTDSVVNFVKGEPKKFHIISDTVIVKKVEGHPLKETKEVRIRLHDSNNNSDGFKGIFMVEGKEYTSQQFKELKLDPQRIESINVLKGDAATAIYNGKGKDGVIVIKLKSEK